MKKFYALFAAALMSASLFATAPTAADLAKEYDVVNNVVLCINPIEDAQVCNDIRFVGTPNNWGKGDPIGTDPDSGDPIYGPESFNNCEKFMPVPGFDGWYAAELPYSEGFEGKPLQEPTDRVWTWDYQCGDMDSWVFVDGNQMNLVAGYDGECNISYASAGAYIYQLKYWKKHKTPCAPVIKHTYTINLYAPDACPDMVPTIAGDFEGWNGTAMNEELDEEFNTVYTISFVDQEGHGFKFKAGAAGDWSNEMQYYDTINDAWANFGNYELGADSIIVLDYSNNDMYRFAKCDASPSEYTVITVNLPALNCPEAVEIIGTFDDWQGTAMEKLETGWYFVALEAKASQYFKFRSAGAWDQELEAYDAENEEWAKIGDNQLVFGQLWQDDTYKGTPCKLIELDLSGENYRWSVAEQGIENVVLTEKAHKVVVDGVIYIVRDNKLFNLQGAQVR
ncbi:MAG: hypothetical protein IKP57_01590 [Paludibacteraceae bacterium]|nr:hypothetical protein [Paludibacteraceae bacterium]